MNNLSTVSDQNGVSLLYTMLEILHSGPEPSNYEYLLWWGCVHSSSCSCVTLLLFCSEWKALFMLLFCREATQLQEEAAGMVDCLLAADKQGGDKHRSLSDSDCQRLFTSLAQLLSVAGVERVVVARLRVSVVTALCCMLDRLPAVMLTSAGRVAAKQLAAVLVGLVGGQCTDLQVGLAVCLEAEMQVVWHCWNCSTVLTEVFQPECCIFTIYHAWDTPFWLGTLDIYFGQFLKWVYFILVISSMLTFLLCFVSLVVFVCWISLPQSSSSFAFHSYISGVHHFGWDFCICGRF